MKSFVLLPLPPPTSAPAGLSSGRLGSGILPLEGLTVDEAEQHPLGFSLW